MESQKENQLLFEDASCKGPVRPDHTAFERRSINCLIVLFIGLATLLALSETELFSKTEARKLRGYFAPIGMRQYWRLFGPQLREYNSHLTAIIEFADGTLKQYEFTRMEKLSIWQRFVKEKQRSLFNQFLPVADNKIFFPSVARYLARANCDKQNQPVKISFIFNYIETPPPDPKHWVYRDLLPEHSRQILHFVYQVMPSDLVVAPGP